MLNASDILRGYTDTIILAQLAKEDSYGYVISKNVQEITRGELQLKEATLYTTFRRLESAGVIESYWGNENAGARRRYYHLTDAGRKLYEENKADWLRYRAMVFPMPLQGHRHVPAAYICNWHISHALHQVSLSICQSG